MKKRIMQVLIVGGALLAVKANATNYEWQLSFFNKDDEFVGEGRFSYNDSTSEEYYLEDDVDYDLPPYNGRYYKILSTDVLWLDSGIDRLDLSLSLPAGSFIAATDGRNYNWWAGNQTYGSLDYAYESTEDEGLWFNHEETVTVIKNVWWTDSVGPGSVFHDSDGYYSNAVENPDQWIVEPDYSLSEVSGDLIMHQFENVGDGVWMGVWKMGNRWEYMWHSHLDDNSEYDGYWIAESTTVPIPAALPLFVSGLGFLLFPRIRRKTNLKSLT